MTGFCGGYGCIDGLEVTHFSDQDNVRVLTESRSQGACEAVYVLPDLTLVYHGLLVGVQILDRILDCDDVAVLGTVDVVYHAASVVDLPEPVGPVTSTRPRGAMANSRG